MCVEYLISNKMIVSVTESVEGRLAGKLLGSMLARVIMLVIPNKGVVFTSHVPPISIPGKKVSRQLT